MNSFNVAIQIWWLSFSLPVKMFDTLCWGELLCLPLRYDLNQFYAWFFHQILKWNYADDRNTLEYTLIPKKLSFFSLFLSFFFFSFHFIKILEHDILKHFIYSEYFWSQEVHYFQNTSFTKFNYNMHIKQHETTYHSQMMS